MLFFFCAVPSKPFSAAKKNQKIGSASSSSSASASGSSSSDDGSSSSSSSKDESGDDDEEQDFSVEVDKEGDARRAAARAARDAFCGPVRKGAAGS